MKLFAVLLLAVPAMADVLSSSSSLGYLFSVNRFTEVGMIYSIDANGFVVDHGRTWDMSGFWVVDVETEIFLPSGSVINSDSVQFSNYQATVIGDGAATTTLDYTAGGLDGSSELQFEQGDSFRLRIGGTADLRYVPGVFPTTPGVSGAQTAELYNLDYAHGGPSERRPCLVDVIQN